MILKIDTGFEQISVEATNGEVVVGVAGEGGKESLHNFSPEEADMLSVLLRQAYFEADNQRYAKRLRASQ